MTLEQRVAKLERQNRWLRRGGAVLVAVAAVALLVGQAQRIGPQEFSVATLLVKDGQVHVVARLDRMGLALYGEERQTRALLSASKRGAAIEFGDWSGKRRVSLGTTEDGAPYLRFMDKTGNIIWEAPPKKEAPTRAQVVEAQRVVIRDADDTTRIELGVFNEEPAIRMLGPEGKKRLSIDLDRDGTPNFFMFDAEGTARAEFVMDSAGTCAFELHDKTGQIRADLTVYSDGTPDLRLLDAEGNVTWEALPEQEAPK